ncbi:BTB/POZ domain-containing protein 6-B-like [Oratosquilla oratoria]|uniref:BTB/POZ domain-containing protein 6-B-like n=1 Tax=Oratosquilla oratoria TaxID=337810 RepID=UPI003F75FDD6
MKNSKERLQYMYTPDENSDLDIVFPEYELTFKAHRVILSMSSSVFGTMLMGPLATEKELILPKDSPHAFQKLLDHIYVDQMDLESVKQALEVYAIAHKYRMFSARETCMCGMLTYHSARTGTELGYIKHRWVGSLYYVSNVSESDYKGTLNCGKYLLWRLPYTWRMDCFTVS